MDDYEIGNIAHKYYVMGYLFYYILDRITKTYLPAQKKKSKF